MHKVFVEEVKSEVSSHDQVKSKIVRKRNCHHIDVSFAKLNNIQATDLVGCLWVPKVDFFGIPRNIHFVVLVLYKPCNNLLMLFVFKSLF